MVYQYTLSGFEGWVVKGWSHHCQSKEARQAEVFRLNILTESICFPSRHLEIRATVEITNDLTVQLLQHFTK